MTTLAWTRIVASGCIAIAACLGSASPLLAQTSTVLFVANDSAFNGSGCGARERPCRSISRAIANAADGDLIEVGPGIYGDIDGDGSSDGVGEEVVVDIPKAVEVYSSAGATLTIIRGTPGLFGLQIVRIRADGVTFGRRNGGFTIIGAKSEGGRGTEGVVFNTSDVTIAGNVAIGNDIGFLADGENVRVDGNVALDSSRAGFAVSRTGSVAGNIANHNTIGFLLRATDITFTGNVATANTEVGVESQVMPGGELIGNTVIGNAVAGFRLVESGLGSSPMAVHRSNIYGNGEGAEGCGLLNESGGFIDATDNYWGKATGPGPNPGDRAYGSCQVSGSTATSPFTTVAFPIEELSGD